MREEFAEGNEFCKKITYRVEEDPKSVLAQFRNDYYPRVAVTVDMIATGTDIKPLECLLFMRDVKSRNYFEQMKGRGTRTLDHDDLKRVSPSAGSGKTHYVIVDAIGVTKSLKTASQPLITRPSVPLKDLAMGVMMGARDEDTVGSLAGRLARLNRRLDDSERRRIRDQAGGVELSTIVGNLLAAIDPDRIEAKAREIESMSESAEPSPAACDEAREQLEIQILAATEAAGEGINLQCCNILFNYDIPWNPNRLEQRMGRIHRYGQRKDCLIFNFVATNTIEGTCASASARKAPGDSRRARR